MNEAQITPLLDDVALGGVLRISGARVRKLANAGRLPEPVLIDGLKRWTPESITNWIRSKQTSGATKSPLE